MVQPKPEHLGPAYGSQFSEPNVVAAYRYRPHYPDELFPFLRDLAGPISSAVLDVGCGDGAIARHLAPLVSRVDAVDPSELMVSVGKRLSAGDVTNIRWINGPIESVPLSPPYALIAAGASIHWFEWAIALPRFAHLVSSSGMLAIIDQFALANPWDVPLQPVINRFSTNLDYRPYDIVQELSRRGLFEKAGVWTSRPVPFRQSVDDYVESFHSRNGFSRDRMEECSAELFDAEVRSLVSPHSSKRMVSLEVGAKVVWGKPLIPDVDSVLALRR